MDNIFTSVKNPGDSCVNDSNCPDGYYCGENKTCIQLPYDGTLENGQKCPDIQTSNGGFMSCKSGYCKNGYCSDPTDFSKCNPTCKQNQICYGGKCVECTGFDNYCNKLPDRTCSNSKCVDRSTLTNCTSDTDCKDGTKCVFGSCVIPSVGMFPENNSPPVVIKPLQKEVSFFEKYKWWLIGGGVSLLIIFLLLILLL